MVYFICMERQKHLYEPEAKKFVVQETIFFYSDLLGNVL